MSSKLVTLSTHILIRFMDYNIIVAELSNMSNKYVIILNAYALLYFALENRNPS